MKMKKILSILFIASVLIAFVNSVEAKPFLSCDPNAGITQYKIEIPAQGAFTTHWEKIVPARADGSLYWDLAEWPHGKGTFNGQVSAGGDWEVTDSATGNVTTVFQFSTPSAFIIKVPSHKVTGIGGR
jgi:hypothetical protein